jgi:hypothetical protein
MIRHCTLHEAAGEAVPALSGLKGSPHKIGEDTWYTATVDLCR